MPRALADIGAVVQVFHWSPRDYEPLTLSELAELAEIARAERRS